MGTGKPKVVLIGYIARGCVSTTARQVAEKERDFILAQDAIDERDIAGTRANDVMKAASLTELADTFGRVLNTLKIAGD